MGNGKAKEKEEGEREGKEGEGEGKGKRNRKWKGKEKENGKRKRERKRDRGEEEKEKDKEKGKVEGRELKKSWTDGRTHRRTDGHSGDFIHCPMLCIALDRQKFRAYPCVALPKTKKDRVSASFRLFYSLFFSLQRQYLWPKNPRNSTRLCHNEQLLQILLQILRIFSTVTLLLMMIIMMMVTMLTAARCRQRTLHHPSTFVTATGRRASTPQLIGGNTRSRAPDLTPFLPQEIIRLHYTLLTSYMEVEFSPIM